MPAPSSAPITYHISVFPLSPSSLRANASSGCTCTERFCAASMYLMSTGQPARGARRFGAGGEVFRQRSASRDAARPVGMHRYLPALGDLVAAFAPVQRFQPVSAPDVVFECGYEFEHLRASAFFIDYITFLSAAQRFAAKKPLFLCFCSLFYMRAAARERLLFMRKRATI